MTVLKTIVLASLLTLPAVPQDTETLPPVTDQVVLEPTAYAAALTSIRANLAGTDRLQAKFRQTNPSRTINEGILSLERPGRIRFDYSDETPFLIVSDGTVLSLIDYEVGQVTKWPVDDTPLRLLLQKDVDFAELGASIMLNPAGLEDHVAMRAQDPDRPELGLITIFFRTSETAPGGLELVSWVVEDAQNRVTVVELYDADYTPDLQESLWTFEDPRGSAKRRNVRRR